MKMRHVAITNVGLVRKENQDSIFTLPSAGTFMVADGMGGEKAGAEASAQVVQTVERVAGKFFQGDRAHAPKDVEEMVRQALQRANEEVFQISVKEPDKTGLGSTGSLLCLHRGLYFVAQVGDSRIYLVRNGELKQITRDHTIVWTLYENGVITRDQLETHPERHLLTQCVGGSKPIDVDVFEDRTQPGDMFLICSDGLTGYAGEAEVKRLLLEPGLELEDRGQKLLKSALDGGGGDNVSVILVQVDELESQDDWQPVQISGSGRPIIAIPPPPLPETAPETSLPPAKSRGGLVFFVAAAALLVGGVVFNQVRSKSVKPNPNPVIPEPVGTAAPPFVNAKTTVEVIFEAPSEMKDAEILVQDGHNKPIPGAIQALEGNKLTLQLPVKAKWVLDISAPGLATMEKPFDLAEYDGKPYRLKLKSAH